MLVAYPPHLHGQLWKVLVMDVRIQLGVSLQLNGCAVLANAPKRFLLPAGILCLAQALSQPAFFIRELVSHKH